MELNKAVLLLADGKEFYGYAAGSIGTTTGELCYNTGMTGYQEIFTDPSYFGQLLIATNVHIGNYGATSEETESKSIQIAGLITKDFNDQYYRPQAEESLTDFFIQQDKVAITKIDTRAVVRYIRDKGAMNAIISSENLDIDSLKSILKDVPSMENLELSTKVTTKEVYDLGAENAEYKIAVLDIGVKKSIIKNFTDRNCSVRVFPAETQLDEIKAWNPDGYFISNGPGDPSTMDYAIQTVSGIIDQNLPLFGICLGHQIIALAAGAKTYKMHNGHRGINHPVKNLITGKCEITSQNHGFGVSMEDVKNNDKMQLTHINLNDNSVEGIRLLNKNVFSVQYHPEASPGPHDSRYLFDDFIQLINNQ